ncbi:MAG TPA: acetylornithine/succinyldiaminopimelate transaminase [Aquella sp.]|nr:acetylornithine/succinyldiaminopimelate transaminase [Aquella sp.]
MNKIHQEYNKYFLNTYGPFDFVPVSGAGSRLYDEDCKEVIDFAGGIAVNGLGHSHPKLIKALTNQASCLWHVSNIMINKPALELARKLVSNTCFDKVFFTNSGTEAVEAGLKLARRYAAVTYGKHKNKIVSFLNGFHGRTLFAVSVGGQSQYQEGFAPLPGGICHGVFNDITKLDELIDDNTAIVIVEPIQGEGGIISATPEFLIKLRELCDKFSCILMFDEVQTGMGRTGKLFAYMNYGVEPDILSSAKALGSGFPIGALLVKNKFSTGFEIGSHGSTFGGNPLATSVANAAFDMINTPEILDGVIKRRQIFIKKLTKLNQEVNVYKEIRGEGLLLGLELHDKYNGLARELIKIGLKHGVLILNASPNVTRLAPSLIIPIEDIDEGIDRFTNTLLEFVRVHG